MKLLGNWGNGNKRFTLYLEKWIVGRQMNKNGSVRCIQNMVMVFFFVTGITHACTSYCCNHLFHLHFGCLLPLVVPTWQLCLPYALKQNNDLIFVGWKCKRCGNWPKTINTVQWEYFAAAKFVRQDWYVQQCSNKCHQWRMIRVLNHTDYQREQCPSPHNNSQQHNGEVAKRQINHSSASKIIHHRLHFPKVCATWVLTQSMEKHKHNCLYICTKLLNWHHKESDTFLSNTVIGDKMWIHQHQPDSKFRSKEQKNLMSPVKKKFTSKFTVAKVMITLFWDLQEPIFEHYLEMVW
jgi:hypothetical protein